MLTRAISAPAHYDSPGILRYNADPPSPMHSVVKFAPLPQTEVFGRRAKFSSRLGVQGRSGFLNQQRQHPNGIDYDSNNATKETAEDPIQDDSVPEPNGHNPTSNSTTSHQEKANLHPPRSGSFPGLRRSASEDGTMSTSSTKRGALKFWKRSSKKPALPTIPSKADVHVLDLSPLQPQIAVQHVGASGVPSAPLVEITTPPAPVEPNQELQIDSSDDVTSPSVESVNSPLTPSSAMAPTSTFTPHSSTVPTPPTKDASSMPSVLAEPATEGVSEKTGIEPVNVSATSEIVEPLEISIPILDEAHLQ
jgi:hypothetical protein